SAQFPSSEGLVGVGLWFPRISTGLSVNFDSQTRMTNDEIRRNTEIRTTNRPLDTRGLFDIRHSTTDSRSQCIAHRGRRYASVQPYPPQALHSKSGEYYRSTSTSPYRP